MADPVVFTVGKPFPAGTVAHVPAADLLPVGQLVRLDDPTNIRTMVALDGAIQAIVQEAVVGPNGYVIIRGTAGRKRVGKVEAWPGTSTRIVLPG